MTRDLDRNSDHVDAWLGHQQLVVGEHRADPEHVGSARSAGMCAMAAQPRSGLTPTIPTPSVDSGIARTPALLRRGRR